MRKHTYRKFYGNWEVRSPNNKTVAGTETELMAQRIARGLDLEAAQRKEAKR